MTVARNTYWLAACTLLVLAALVFDLNGYPLLDPDEGRNAEVAREMAETNDYVLPRLNGLPYVDKPVLFFATLAATMELLGPTAFAARLPPLAFTFCTLGLVAWFARRILDRDAAWTAVIASAATPFTLAYARTVIFDSALTFFVVAALVSFFMAADAWNGEWTKPNERTDLPPYRPTAVAWWRALAWCSMALGVLTKGPIALALPLMVAIPYALWRRAGRALVDAVAVLLFVAILLPWIITVSQQVPGFLAHALVTETFVRLTSPDLERTGPLWYFLAILPAAVLPWSVVVAVAWKARARTAVDRRMVFLLLWIMIPVLFFTLSQSKRPHYILPLVPAVGLLVAALWHNVVGRLPGARAAAVVLGTLGVFFVAGRHSIAGLIPASAPVSTAIPATATALGAICIAAGVVAWLGAQQRHLTLIGLSLPLIAIPLASRDLMDAIGEYRSSAQIAEAMSSGLPARTQVVGVRALPLSLPFYLGRTIVVSTADAAEFTSNYLVRHYDRWANTPESPLRSTDWWYDALTSCSSPRAFVVNSRDTEVREILAPRVRLIIDTGKYAVYGPCGVTGIARMGS